MNSTSELRWVWDHTAGDDRQGDWVALPGLPSKAIQWDSHRADAELEDVEWLVGRGVPVDQACARVGVSRGTYEKRLART